MRRRYRMKLYEIERGSKILLPIMDGDKDLGEQMCTFNWLDGAYSNISTPDNHTVHLSASAELIKAGDYYKLATQSKETD